MPLDDEDAYELARRRLEDDVKKKVEDDLFRYYRNIGSIIITVLGMVGITIGWPALLSRIDDQIQIKVQEPVEAATKIATKAKKIADEILVRLEDKQENLNQSIGRLGGKFDEMHNRYGAASAKIEEVETNIGEIKQLTEFFRIRIQNKPVSREDINQLEARLTTVISETRKLASVVKTLDSNSLDQDLIAASVDKNLKKIDIKFPSNVKSDTNRVSRSNSTVYVQFAGGKREDIQLISQNLRDVGWTVPGEERLRTALGKRVVRYFHDSDEKAAELLAQDVNKAIVAVGFSLKKEEEMKWNKVFAKNLPAVGILEVWLEIPIHK